MEIKSVKCKLSKIFYVQQTDKQTQYYFQLWHVCRAPTSDATHLFMGLLSAKIAWKGFEC